MAPLPVLRVSGITKPYRYGIWPKRQTLTVLGDADLELCAGEVVGLVGENGSGKSILVKILAGAVQSHNGAVSVRGTIEGGNDMMKEVVT